MTAVQNIDYVTNTDKPALAAYLAAGGLKPVVVEASLSGEPITLLAHSGFPMPASSNRK